VCFPSLVWSLPSQGPINYFCWEPLALPPPGFLEGKGCGFWTMNLGHNGLTISPKARKKNRRRRQITPVVNSFFTRNSSDLSLYLKLLTWKKIEAKYKDGILKVIIEKKEESTG